MFKRPGQGEGRVLGSAVGAGTSSREQERVGRKGEWNQSNTCARREAGGDGVAGRDGASWVE